ncbi:MAG: hypothetical protein ACKV22_22385 [Bryobacteraceae bacterium]
MPIQLTPEQERRIQAIVEAGVYSTAREALDAALAAVEIAAGPGFDGPPEELEGILLQGLASRELSEEEFWDSVDRNTSAMLAVRKPSSRT